MSASSVIAETMLAGDFNFGGLAGPAVVGNVVQKSIERPRGKKFPLTAYFDNQFVRELEKEGFFQKLCADEPRRFSPCPVRKRRFTMTFVSEVLKAKGGDVWTVSSDSSVYDALQEMADRNVGALMVVEGGNLVGVFSERDYARKVILQGKASRDTLVREIMSSEVFWVRPDQTIGACMELMTDKRVRHLPVLDGGRLIGVISIGDAVKAIISEQQFAIQQLEQYIGQR